MTLLDVYAQLWSLTHTSAPTYLRRTYEAPWSTRTVFEVLAEKTLRREGQKSDTFSTFCRKRLRVAPRYPSPESLIPSMAKRVKATLKHGSGHDQVLTRATRALLFDSGNS